MLIAYRRYIGFCFRSFEVILIATDVGRFSGLRANDGQIQAMGFWMFGVLSVVLAVLKLTVAGYWSWWRVMLPFLAFLGHNAVYLLAGFLCFCWLKHEEDEEEPSTVQKHSREGYNIAALLFFFLFLDNLLRRVEGQGWKGFWPCSGRFEVVVLFGMLSLVAQLVYWSRIVSGLNQEHA